MDAKLKTKTADNGGPKYDPMRSQDQDLGSFSFAVRTQRCEPSHLDLPISPRDGLAAYQYEARMQSKESFHYDEEMR